MKVLIDTNVLVSAICEADYFITGDGDFVEAQRLINTVILSVSLFKRLMLGE